MIFYLIVATVAMSWATSRPFSVVTLAHLGDVGVDAEKK